MVKILLITVFHASYAVVFMLLADRAIADFNKEKGPLILRLNDLDGLVHT